MSAIHLTKLLLFKFPGFVEKEAVNAQLPQNTGDRKRIKYF